MKNSLGRWIPDDAKPFISSHNYLTEKRKFIEEKKQGEKTLFFSSYKDAFHHFKLKSEMTFSFHHHLRNGDYVLNQVCKTVEEEGLTNLHFAPSSIFPSYIGLIDLIKNEQITNIHTNYLNGPVSSIIKDGFLKGKLIMNTHGGRARSIESGELPIDVAFLACPTVDKLGNGSGSQGKSACGTLGYAISDLKYAKTVLLVTDNVIEHLDEFQFDHKYVDGIIVVDSIGDPSGIVSGTTKITRDPIGLKIAKDTSILLNELGVLQNGFSMQTGAGGTSLAVVDYIKNIMIKKSIKGSFASGGITGHYVDMMKHNLFSRLYDVQCFDLEAIKSFKENSNHIAISASKYGNPFEESPIVNDLSFVILGATEIDLDFNVNVTTDSLGNIIGGSGGHSDTSNGANITIITSALTKSRVPIIKERVTTISTPGEDVDILVTERGIAINPKRQDLISKLIHSSLKIVTIEKLMEITYKITGIPKAIEKSDSIIGLVEYRDGSIIDCLYKSR
ncbi:MAG: citrate lyase subunit alpha [Firmicutes bacterium]|nr:citrate lyase subunit alpha [Bacillota bacterium]